MVMKMRRKGLKDLTSGDLYGYGELVIERERNRMVTIIRKWDYPGSAMVGLDIKSYMIKRSLYEIDNKNKFISKCVESGDINPHNENYQEYKKILREANLW